jgi:NO-binding membrane sensor protein with MHYT domain
MHFIAMLGFRVSGMDIRYGVNLTLLSALVAIVVVGIGIFIVGYGGSRPIALIGGGLVTGLGVASMHYMGMGAMNMTGRVDYDPPIVGASILIAVVAATVALWFTVRVKGHWVTAGAALVMGVAVSGMHYTGMAAMQVVEASAVGTPSGASAFDFLLPLIIGISVFAMLLLVTIGLSLTEDEMQLERQFEQQLRERALQRETGGDFIPTAPDQRSWISR